MSLIYRVRECQLLLIASKNNSCSYIPPYVDEYGEPDQGLRLVSFFYIISQFFRYGPLKEFLFVIQDTAGLYFFYVHAVCL